MNRITLLLWVGLLGVLPVGQGCQERRTLAATPNIWHDRRGAEIFEQVPAELRTPDMDVLYVTDRAILKHSEAGPVYGHTRSRDITFGSAKVSIKPEPTWEQLVVDSQRAQR